MERSTTKNSVKSYVTVEGCELQLWLMAHENDVE